MVMDWFEDKFGVWWELPESELCAECLQPDNSGDCNHARLSKIDIGKLGGMLRFWLSPRPDLGINIWGYETYSSYQEDLAITELGRKRGYLFGKWFCVACVNGEHGDQHISRCIPIDAELFTYARSMGWTPRVGVIPVIDLEAMMQAEVSRQATLN